MNKEGSRKREREGGRYRIWTKGSRKREREGGRYRIWTKREAGRERGREEGIGYGQRGKQEEREGGRKV